MQFTFSSRSLLAALPAPAPSGAEPGSLANSIRSRIRMLSAKTNFGQPVLGCLATKLTERTVANPALRGVHLVPEEGLREPEESLHLRNVGKKLRIEVEGNLFQATYVPNLLPFLTSQMFCRIHWLPAIIWDVPHNSGKLRASIDEKHFFCKIRKTLGKNAKCCNVSVWSGAEVCISYHIL